jgi:archaellum biogenesis ATPase FlaH
MKTIMSNNKELYPSGSLNEADLRRDISKQTKTPADNNVLHIMEANEWIEIAKSKPEPIKLIDCLWYQGELCILFADTNLGKSIFAVQAADFLSGGNPIPPFSSYLSDLNVLYCDFEMSDKQFENRYSRDYQNHYKFNKRFLRAELNLDDFLLKSDKPIEEQISNQIISLIEKNNINVVIIDNLTYLIREIEKSKNIQPLMQKLKWINKEYNVSIMVLAHTPKRDISKPITSSDINGSKFLSNFADSIIAIGKSAEDEQLRYVKQIKSRNSAIKYGEDNVLIYRIAKPHNFLQFMFERYDLELNHLKRQTKEEIKQLEQDIIELHRSKPELSYEDIAQQLNTYKMKAKRVIDKTHH